MPKRCLEQVPNGDARQPVLRLTCFESDQVVLAHVNLRCVLDQDDPLIGRDESPEYVGERSFA